MANVSKLIINERRLRNVGPILHQFKTRVPGGCQERSLQYSPPAPQSFSSGFPHPPVGTAITRMKIDLIFPFSIHVVTAVDDEAKRQRND